MKKVSEELRYDGATIEQVHEMLATVAFRDRSGGWRLWWASSA